VLDRLAGHGGRWCTAKLPDYPRPRLPRAQTQILAARFKKSGPTIAHQKQGIRPRIYTFWIKHDFYCCITDKLLIQNLIELI
jgi:hypothetical protein